MALSAAALSVIGVCVGGLIGWNATDDFICYGRQGELATNSREQQEVVTLSLQLPDQHNSGRARH
jgi:hypothetical protein